MVSYRDYLELVEYILLIIIEAVAIYHFGKSLLKIFKEIKNNGFYFCPNLRNLIFVSFMSSVAAFIYALYMAIFWRFEPKYNIKIMFYTGWYDNTWLPVVSVAFLFGTIEKAIMIKFSYAYDDKFKRIVHTTGIFICYLLLFVNGIYFLLNMQYPTSPKVNSFVCLCESEKRYTFWIIKTVFAALNVIVGIYFFYLLKIMPQTSESNARNNKLALTTLLAIFLFDLLPGTLYFLATLFELNLLSYTGGPSIRLLSSIFTLYLAITYDKNFKRIIAPIHIDYNVGTVNKIGLSH